MYRVTKALIIMLVALVGASVSASAAEPQRAAPGSFLQYRASSAEALAKEISTNKIVGERYARHYGTSASSFSRYVEQNLSLITLKQPKQMTVYFISKKNSIKGEKRRLPAGTLVYATASGEPVLEWRCGNPLGKILPVVSAVKPVQEQAVTAAQPKPTVPVTEIPTAIAEPTVEVAAAVPIEIGQIPAVETAVAPVVPTVIPPVDPVIVPPAVAPVAPAVTATTAAASSKFPWIVPVLLGGGLLGAGGGGGDTPPDPIPDPIPEPGSLAFLTSGIAAVAAGIRFKTRR